MSAPLAGWRRTLRARAERVRDCALEPLAARLGYSPDPRHHARWRRGDSVLSIRGSKFFDHACGRGGGGAIDLVMHARRCGFREALAFLDAETGSLPPAATAPPPQQQPLLPDPVARHWPEVRVFLARVRALDPALLEQCHRDGRLYADRRRNAVFPCRDLSGCTVGAELVGTRPRPDGSTFKGLAAGSRRDRGGFSLATSPHSPSAVLLVESAIDALSAILLPAPDLPADCLVVSTAGTAGRLPRWLTQLSHAELLCGFDADPPGDQAARALSRRLPRLRRLRPNSAKDWNDLLRRRSPR